MLAAGLALAPAVALAQQAQPQAAPPPDSVGPGALQDFTLNGTVTRPAEPVVAQPASPSTRQAPREIRPPQQEQPAAAKAATAAATSAPAPKHAGTAVAEPTPRLPKQEQPPLPAAAPLPERSSVAAAAAPAPAPSFAPSPGQPAGVLTPGHSFPILAWLLAALAAVLGGGFLFWRTRQGEAFAGGAQFDLFAAPEPSFSPAPTPAPRAAPMPAPAPASRPAAPATTGVVSTRLRPWIEIGFRPLRCVLQDEIVTVEFEIELFNSGDAPARTVLVEARLFNAGAEQDAHIGEFFARPGALGDRIPVIPPLKRLAVKSQAIAPRDQLLAYELAGRPVFVPLIGFNALYSWSGGEGQTSVSHLIGRDTKNDKLAPFRLDLGPHIFRGLGARTLPTSVRK